MAAAAPNLSYVLGQGSTGWRELDISSMIKNQSPDDRPFFELCGDATATSWKHEWQTRTLRARAVNALAEGANFTYRNVRAPSRPSNTCQILEDGIEVSGTSQAEGHYGAPNLMSDQVKLNAKQHGLDIEYSLIRGLETTGNTAHARIMGGLMSIITTNKTAMLGITMTEQHYVRNLLQTIWSATNDRPNTVLCNAELMNAINAFNAFGATRWLDTMTREIVVEVLRYQSSFGSVSNYLCRDLSNGSSNGEICAFDRTQMKKAWLRSTKLKPVAPQADSEQAVMISELTLEYGNELATAKMTNLYTT